MKISNTRNDHLVLTYISSFCVQTQQLVEDACAVNITSRRIEQLTKEHRALVVKAQMEREAIEDLQRSNDDISQTIQNLEQRLSTMFQEHDDVLAQLDDSKRHLHYLSGENDRMRQVVISLKETVDILPSEVEAMSRDEFEVLCTENATLIEKNCSLEDQLVSKNYRCCY
jgi:FtsZ-binding cell division protein ZapB